MSEEMSLLILKLFNASYYCVKQYGHNRGQSYKEKEEVWPVMETSIVSIQVKPSIKAFLFSVTILKLQGSKMESLVVILKGTDLFYSMIPGYCVKC